MKSTGRARSHSERAALLRRNFKPAPPQPEHLPIPEDLLWREQEELEEMLWRENEEYRRLVIEEAAKNAR